MPAASATARTRVLALALAALAGSWSCAEDDGASRPPNILLILADDLGYGDVSAYNDEAKVETKHLDSLAQQGLRFTDAHSPSTVCTPTRYGILTGRMPFRTGMRGVFTGVEGPCLIEPGRLTLAQMLREAGYATALVGKWHLGMTFFDAQGQPVHEIDLPAQTREERSAAGVERVRRVDFSRAIPDGPLNWGFDQFFGTVACPTTDWLYAWIDGDRVPVPPESLLDRTPLPKHPYANDNRRGLVAPDYDLERVDLVFLERSVQFLEEHASREPDRPFFLFHSMQAVHLPSFAAPEFQGKTSAGPHGDFLFEMDFIVGELMAALDRLGLAEETLVLFTSDNGPEVATTYHMRRGHDHDGARPWRGIKRDQWEGGHRVPTIARWPGKIQSGLVSDQLFNLTDIMATAAALAGYALPAGSAEDSFDFSALLTGTHDGSPIRNFALHQTISLDLALRRGAWKYLDHSGSGGNDYTRPLLADFALDDGAPDAPAQLFNLASDPGETRNLYYEEPETASRMKQELEDFKASGRSAPGQ
jgi:arylsulfatase A-like enzyme